MKLEEHALRKIIATKAREVGMTEFIGKLRHPTRCCTIYYGIQNISDDLVNMLEQKIL